MTARTARPFRRGSARAPAAPAAPAAAAPPSGTTARIGVDEPITSPDADLLDRGAFVRSIAASVEMRPQGGVTFAIAGPPGSGKSSVLRLVAGQLGQTLTVINFNPWYFSGSGDLVGHFLRELASEMSSNKDKRLQSISEHLRSYSALIEPLGFLPFVGGFAKAGQQAIGLGAATAEYSKRFKESGILLQREELHAALHEFDVRIVVVIDDVDRLTDQEISEVARLVRLVGHLPRINYLLAFDRERVESALAGGRAPAWGREYLAKVVQSLRDLPDPLPEALGNVFDHALAFLTPTLAAGIAGDANWNTVRAEVVTPLLRTPRDAVRLAMAVSVGLESAGAGGDPAELLALEARRLLAPQPLG